MAAYDSDLFGEVPAIPRRGSKGRAAYIADLELPYGLKFWSLAPPRQVSGAPDYVETIWCVDEDGKWANLIVDLRTGNKWDGS